MTHAEHRFTIYPMWLAGVVAAIIAAAFVPLCAMAEDATQTQTADTTNTSSSVNTSSDPYQYQRQGVFDCNQNGAYAMSIGSLGAIGGAYVPVADAAVELNTGILVYKECVLREVVVKEREAAMAAYLRKGTVGIQTGRDGKSLFVQNQREEELTYIADPELLAMLQGGAFDALNPTLKNAVIENVVRSYRATTRTPEQKLTCSYKGDLDAVLDGNPPSGDLWNALTALANPACTYGGAYLLAQEYAERRIARAIDIQRTQWDWNNGYYAKTDENPDPLLRKILTPGITVQQSYQTLLDSPVRQMESANDVGQMIGALYAGVTTQIISDIQGLSGLTRSSGSKSSYLDQLVKESSLGVRNAAVNAALQILNAANKVEAQYLEVVNAIAARLTKAINDLRGAEAQCWNLVIQKTCATPLAADNTCTAQGQCITDPSTGTQTCTTGSRLRVATSTAYSQQIIDAQITPLATTTLQNIAKSKQALTLIANLIEGLVNTASLDAQRLALQQLDSLVAQHALHLQPDLATVTEQRDKVDASMDTLTENTVKAWADATGGWCNANDQSVIQAWITKWTI